MVPHYFLYLSLKNVSKNRPIARCPSLCETRNTYLTSARNRSRRAWRPRGQSAEYSLASHPGGCSCAGGSMQLPAGSATWSAESAVPGNLAETSPVLPTLYGHRTRIPGAAFFSVETLPGGLPSSGVWDSERPVVCCCHNGFYLFTFMLLLRATWGLG